MELSYDYFVKGCQGDGPEGAGVGHAKACFNAALLDLNEFQGAYKRSTPANPKAGVEFLKKVGGEDNFRRKDGSILLFSPNLSSVFKLLSMSKPSFI